ncbi:MAG: twin-arginine translocation signal domain-containing protein, partial [Verrucomicrobia bacterium]|nr:twin-arginine translocation signal domain-containing protein [Verrucomicrobiota bacterium]
MKSDLNPSNANIRLTSRRTFIKQSALAAGGAAL